MLSMLKYIMLFRCVYLQQETCIASSWHAEQPSLGTASAEHPAEVDVTTAEPTGNGRPRECSLGTFCRGMPAEKK